jgi:hypothetical protein
MGSALSLITRDGQGIWAMRYGQTATSDQITLFSEEHTPKTKQASIPIYRVMLVREGKIPTYESRIRSSATASTLLQIIGDGSQKYFSFVDEGLLQ